MKLLTTTLFLLLIINFIWSQPLGPLEPAPFGFVEVLAGAAIIMGGRELQKRRRENSEE